MKKIISKKILQKFDQLRGVSELDSNALEFQPDSIELEKQPVPLVTKLTYYLLLILVASALIWSILAKMDMIVTARGKLISTGKQIVVQPLVNSIIKKFHVDVGQVVKKGQPLVSLDPTFAMADEAQVKGRLAILKVQMERLECELAGKQFKIAPGMDPTEASIQMNLYSGRQSEYKARLENYLSQIIQAKGEVASFTKRLESLNRQMNSAKEILSMRQKVFKEGADTRLSVLDAEGRFSAIQADAEAVANDLKVRKQHIDQAVAQRDAFINNWHNDTANKLTSVRKDFDSLKEQLAKASRYRELAELSSPADAVVLELGQYSIGSVVKEGMAIMTLVPVNNPLEAEVSIETKDIGYVHIGNDVRLKLDAFPFQRHGTLDGKLRIVSEDAYVANNGEGGQKIPTFQARVELTNTRLHDVSPDTRFLPGMTLAAEIVVGKRRVISFLAYPLIRGLDESLREP